MPSGILRNFRELLCAENPSGSSLEFMKFWRELRVIYVSFFQFVLLIITF